MVVIGDRVLSRQLEKREADLSGARDDGFWAWTTQGQLTDRVRRGGGKVAGGGGR